MSGEGAADVSPEIVDAIALLLRHADNGLTVAEANEDERSLAMIRSRFALFIADELAAGRHRGEAGKQGLRSASGLQAERGNR